VNEFDWRAFWWQYSRVLAERPVAALVEFAVPEFVSLARFIHDAGGKVVYDLIDAWNTSLGAGWYSPRIEREMIARSDLLIASAPALVRKLQAASGRGTALVPNAFDSYLFDPSVPQERPNDLPASGPIYTYVGSLWGEWFDWELLLRVALASPECSVVVIGDYRGECRGYAPNLHFLGLKPQASLPAYLAHSDAAILPWKRDAISVATSPVKVYEYLAMGLPVVATDLEALPDHPLVYRAAGHEQFIRALSSAAGRLAEPDTLRVFRQENAWSARVDAIEHLIQVSGACPSEGR
jgi:glycosyltransferase involved in cell wall biosynthesis